MNPPTENGQPIDHHVTLTQAEIAALIAAAIVVQENAALFPGWWELRGMQRSLAAAIRKLQQLQDITR
jgi:hypothetical protein